VQLPPGNWFAPPGSIREAVAEATKLSEVVASSRAQEQERHRIARELRDDVVQRLALLSLEREGVQEDIPNVAWELRTRAKQTSRAQPR
jgi:signal transduction histidine kinase